MECVMWEDDDGVTLEEEEEFLPDYDPIWCLAEREIVGDDQPTDAFMYMGRQLRQERELRGPWV